MRLNDKAWTAHDYGVRERTVSDCTRGACPEPEFFVDEAEAWDAVAEINRAEAEQKQLGADEAVKRMEVARATAKKLREAAR